MRDTDVRTVAAYKVTVANGTGWNVPVPLRAFSGKVLLLTHLTYICCIPGNNLMCGIHLDPDYVTVPTGTPGLWTTREIIFRHAFAGNGAVTYHIDPPFPMYLPPRFLGWNNSGNAQDVVGVEMWYVFGAAAGGLSVATQIQKRIGQRG